MKPKLRFEPDAALAHLRAADSELAALIDRIGGFALELKSADTLFEAMLQSIIYQQLHGKAAATIHGRVLAILEKHGGPNPEALTKATDEELRGAGLSRAKLAAVRDLAAKCIEFGAREPGTAQFLVGGFGQRLGVRSAVSFENY